METLRSCCEQAKAMDGYSKDEESSDHSPIAGVLSRISVMACLHFDFRQSLQYLQNFEVTQDSLRHQYAEEETNKKIFVNILNSLKDIQSKSANDLMKGFRESINADRNNSVQIHLMNVDNLVN